VEKLIRLQRMRSNGQAFNPGKQEKKSELRRRKRMTLDERSRLEALDMVLRSDSARDHIHSVVLRVREELTRKKDALMSWDAVPLHIFATTLPA
jgi:hypothetical protein